MRCSPSTKTKCQMSSGTRLISNALHRGEGSLLHKRPPLSLRIERVSRTCSLVSRRVETLLHMRSCPSTRDPLNIFKSSHPKATSGSRPSSRLTYLFRLYQAIRIDRVGEGYASPTVQRGAFHVPSMAHFLDRIPLDPKRIKRQGIRSRQLHTVRFLILLFQRPPWQSP